MMDPADALSELDEYRFEAAGWFVLPAILSVEDLAELNALLDVSPPAPAAPPGTTAGPGTRQHALLTQLGGHPCVRAAIDMLVSGKVQDPNAEQSPPLHALLRPPSVLRDGGTDGFLEQWADGKIRDYGKTYLTSNGSRVCTGVCAVWCLDESSDFLLVPGSHCASVPTPASVLGQGSVMIHGPAGDAGGVKLPPLKPGDVLLHAANMVWGRRGGASAGRLLTAEFTAVNDAQNLHEFGAEVPPPPDWLQDLTPTQQTALGWHPSGANGGDSGAALLSDGLSSWVSPAIDAPLESVLYGTADQPANLREPERHPAPGVTQQEICQLSSLSPETAADELERWRWDVSGMLILRGVMDKEWLAQAHEAIDYITGAEPRGDDAPTFSDPDAWQARGRFFAGLPNPNYEQGRRLFDPREWKDGPKGPPPAGGLLGLPHPLCDPFRRMLDCPAFVLTLNKLMGAGWAIPHGARLGIRTTRRGDPGLFLHAGSDPVNASNQQTMFGDGRTHTEYINVTWQLRDVNCDGKRDGGFNCIPGSHHATKVPSRSEAWVGAINVLENPDSLWESGHLVCPEMRAGDLLFFMGAGMTHGADAWRADEDRCAILMNVWGSNMIRGRRPMIAPKL